VLVKNRKEPLIKQS